jgi:hypothetical protein
MIKFEAIKETAENSRNGLQRL